MKPPLEIQSAGNLSCPRNSTKGVLMKTTLLAATAIIALTAGAATGATIHPSAAVTGLKIHPLHVPPSTLYNQNSSGNGAGFDSQNFTSGSFSSLYNSAGADDFVLSSTSKMTGVGVSGEFFNGSGPAGGATANLYTGGKHPKGNPIATGVSSTTAASFSVKIKGKLKAGKHYWISVVTNCSYVGGCGEWAWDNRSVAKNNVAVWENPGGGFGTTCSTWKPIGDCTSYTTFDNNDFLFDITGK